MTRKLARQPMNWVGSPPAATYLESIASNTEAMVEGVSGGAISCELPAGDH